MPDYDLSQVQGFVVDAESNTRRLLRGILVRMGMPNILEFDSTTAAQEAFHSNAPDFLFIDADQGSGDGLKWVSSLRHNAFACNPFLPIISMTWQPTQPLMIRFTGSGADDMMVKPFSTNQVQERIFNLIEARRSFVVTSDYLGPDRRKSPREGIQIPLFDVPNTLRLKAVGAFERGRIPEQIALSLRAINDQKVIRHGFQAAFLVDFAIPGMMQDPPTRIAVDHICRAAPVIEDLLRRLPSAVDGRAMAETYAKAILAQIDQFKVDVTVPIPDGRVLRRAAMGLAAMAARRMDVATVEQEVSSAVASYRARIDQMTQAKAAAAAESAKSGG